MKNYSNIKSTKYKISIIVPVYNTEKYLCNCIDSILSQTFTDVEILLIDDGSTDRSGEICDEYANDDVRIKVIHKQNTGVSDTRNYALNIVQGDYVIFLDSDDYWCDNSCLQQLYDIAERNQVDIVRGEYKAVDAKGNYLFNPVFNNKKQECQYQILEASIFVEDVVQLEFFMVLCLFRSSIFKNMRFNVNRIFLEDVELFIRILLKAPKCYYLPLYFYAYRKHSETVSCTTSLKKLEDAFSISYFFKECLESAHDRNFKQYCIDESIRRYFRSMSQLTISTFFLDRSCIIKRLNLDQLQKDVKSWMGLTKTKFYSPIYYLRPSLGVWYMKCRNIILDSVYRCSQLLKKIKKCING